MKSRRVVVATGNAGKLAELQAMLGSEWSLVAQGELGIESAEETGESFRDNAVLKARHASRLSGLPAIADDSGLEVDALGGEPGVRSARYAGEPADDGANNARLLKALEGLPDARRTARFRCCMVYVDHADAEPVVAEGCWDGRIATQARGCGGFGYDPLFIDPDSGLHSAQLSAAEKNRRSHRGKAVRALCDQLRQLR